MNQESSSIMEGTRIPIPNNMKLNQLFQLNLQKKSTNDRIAIIFEDSEKESINHITYGNLEKKSNQIARKIAQYLDHHNRKKPNKDGDYVITVSMEPSEKLIITLLAIWKIGAAYLPLDVNTPKNRLEHILNEVHPLVMISDRKLDSNFVYKLDYNTLDNESSTASVSPLSILESVQKENASSTAIILYTSGSTGVPKGNDNFFNKLFTQEKKRIYCALKKSNESGNSSRTLNSSKRLGVRLPHNVITNRLNWQWRTFPFGESERVCVFKTAITFVDAVSEIWAPILYSEPRTLLIIPKSVTKDPEKLVNILHINKVERLVLVPSLLQAILMYVEMMKKQSYVNCDFLKNLKLWVCSGEPLPVSLVDKFFNYFNDDENKLCNFYGSTEIMGDVSYHVLSSSQQLIFGDKIPIGIPLDNTTLYLLDQNFRPVKQGEMGELFVAGYNVAAGYVAQRDPERFIKNPFSDDFGFDKLYRTGDYGRIVKNVLLYEGRTDSQIKIRGQRVDLSEVQAALNSLKAIQKAAVLCYKPGDINQAIVAFVTLQSGYNTNANEIQSKLKESLVHYAIPRVFITDNMPLLNNGKVDRQKLLKLYASNTENESKRSHVEIDYKGIENNKLKTAKCLFETIASVIGLSSQQVLSIKSNFYEIGGNSLNSIQTITKLREKGYFIGIAEFISATDLGSILNRMQPEKQDKENIPNIVDLHAKNTRRTNYRSEMLSEKHKDAVYRIITDSFYQKADLEQWLIPKLKPSCYTELLDAIWEALINKNLSFVVYSEDHKKYIGTTLNFDAHDEPEVNIDNNLNIIFEFLEFLEGPIRDKKLPVGKRQLLHNFMIGTDTSLNAVENIEVVTFMETEVIKIAKRKGFIGVLTTNTNPLTQQLGRDVFKYQTLLDYQVNQYVASDGSEPFGEAPDDQRAIVAWKSF